MKTATLRELDTYVSFCLKKKTSKQKGKPLRNEFALSKISAATTAMKKPEEKPKDKENKKKSSRLSDSSDDSTGEQIFRD